MTKARITVTCKTQRKKIHFPQNTKHNIVRMSYVNVSQRRRHRAWIFWGIDEIGLFFSLIFFSGRRASRELGSVHFRKTPAWKSLLGNPQASRWAHGQAGGRTFRRVFDFVQSSDHLQAFNFWKITNRSRFNVSFFFRSFSIYFFLTCFYWTLKVHLQKFASSALPSWPWPKVRTPAEAKQLRFERPSQASCFFHPNTQTTTHPPA